MEAREKNYITLSDRRALMKLVAEYTVEKFGYKPNQTQKRSISNAVIATISCLSDQDGGVVRI